MSDKRKYRLIDLGAETLAEALLKLALYNEEVDDLVERLISTPDENIQRFKAKIEGLKHSRHFVHWHESARIRPRLGSPTSDA